MATAKVSYVWWVLMPPGSNEGSFTSPKIPSTAKIFKVVGGSSADVTLQNGGTITISGGQWTPALAGSFPTEAAAKAAAPPAGLAALGSLAGAAVGGGLLGTSEGATGTGIVGEAASEGQSIAPNIPGLAQIGDFFARLTEGNTWLRVLEAILGAGLILVGLAHLAGNTQVGRTAKTIATRAALL
jgi:hypothetical protein